MTADLWGVGAMADGTLLPLSTEDIHRDTAAASRAVRVLGIGRDDHVVVISTNVQAGQVWPLLVALIDVGAIFSPVDSSIPEARRFEGFQRRLGLRAVLGVTNEIIDGLAALDLDAVKVLGSVPVVLAQPAAADRLRSDGLAVKRMCLVGPALALDCPLGRLHLDGQSWQVDDRQGRLVMRPRLDRAACPAGRLIDTGLEGSVGAVRCSCGRDDPWVDLEPRLAMNGGRGA